jgi:hypothetical protein
VVTKYVQDPPTRGVSVPTGRELTDEVVYALVAQPPERPPGLQASAIVPSDLRDRSLPSAPMTRAAPLLAGPSRLLVLTHELRIHAAATSIHVISAFPRQG